MLFFSSFLCEATLQAGFFVVVVVVDWLGFCLCEDTFQAENEMHHTPIQQSTAITRCTTHLHCNQQL